LKWEGTRDKSASYSEVLFLYAFFVILSENKLYFFEKNFFFSIYFSNFVCGFINYNIYLKHFIP